MNRLVLLRHGESIWNFQNKFTGWEDVELTSKGIKEAVYAGGLLQDEGFEFDLAFTSLLKRANDTLYHCLHKMNLENIEIHKSWRLNERHYGSLQGLNKKETAKKYGERRVLLWRRSYDIRPPKLDAKDKSHPINNAKYSMVEKSLLPSSESLRDVIKRFLPLWNSLILNKIKSGKKILIVAHGNSLRALVKHLNKISDESIVNFNIPTGVPLVFDLNNKFTPLKNYYLGDQDRIIEKINNISKQGSLK